MFITSLVIASARRVFCCSDFPGHNFTITWGMVPSLFRGFAWHDPERCGAGALADHRLEVRAARVFRAIGVIDAVVDLPAHRLEGDFLRHPRGRDSPRLLPQRGLVPPRFLAVIRT